MAAFEKSEEIVTYQHTCLHLGIQWMLPIVTRRRAAIDLTYIKMMAISLKRWRRLTAVLIMTGDR